MKKTPTELRDDTKRIERMREDFTHHPPSEETQDAMADLRKTFKLLGERVIDICPDNDEREEALKSMKIALHWSMASLALGEKRAAQ